MIKRKTLHFTMVMMAILLLVSSLIGIPAQTIQAQQNTQDAREILDNLTTEQRQAIKELDVEVGFTVHPEVNQESDAPVEVIVEFKQDPAKVALAKSQVKAKSTLSLGELEQKVDESHQDFKQAIEALEIKPFQHLDEYSDEESIEITHEYRDALNGVAMIIPGTAIKELLKTGLVKRVWNNDAVQLDLPDVKEKNIEPKMVDGVPQIGADRLHKDGIEGAGIKVGVIDTGIDYNHPDLTNAYKGYRLKDDEDAETVDPDSVLGWDFIDNDANPMEATYDDWLDSGEPEMDEYENTYYTSHGTHVSGTVAGQQENNVDHAVKGVAPGVDLYAYRVLGPYGSGGTDGVIGGIDKSVRDEMDVINLSLGTAVNDPLSPVSIAVNHAMLSGVFTVVAAGNAGPEPQTVGAPGTAALPISVGASNALQTIPTYTGIVGETTYSDVQLLAKNFSDNIEELEGESLPLINAGIGNAEGFEGKDVTGKIALIERGGLSFDEKLIHAKNAGAKAVIVYNDEEGQIELYVGESSDYLPAFRVSHADGLKLVEAAESESLFEFGELTDIQSEGDYLADFSSRGPVAYNYDIKPDVIAPGVSIFSTYPSFINDPTDNSYETAYARIQGTSMASPHVAGAAALVLEAHPDYTPFEVKTALMNTSVDLKDDYSVYEVGAGRINVYDAVYSETMITVVDVVDMIDNDEEITIDNHTGSLRFGSYYVTDDKVIDSTKEVRLTNQSEDKKEYSLDVEFLEAEGNRQDAVDNGVVLDLPESVTVKGGDEEVLEVDIQLPETAAKGTYEGYVRVTDDQEESYQIPFAIRLSEKGFNLMDFDRPAVPNVWRYHPLLLPFMSLKLNLKSPMEQVDLVIKDSETNEPLGIVGAFYDLQPDNDYFASNGFMGYIYPFTGDEDNPIEDELERLPEGDYVYEILGTDKDGDEYSMEKTVVVDNTPPEMSFSDYEPGIIEVDESMYTKEFGQEGFWIHTNIYDSTIDVLNDNGYNFDQSSNLVTYYQNAAFPNVLGVAPDGSMDFGVLPNEIDAGPVVIDLDPVDLATNADTRGLTRYTIVEKGTAYGVQGYDKDKVYLGDEFTMTLDLKHVESLLSGTFGVQYDHELYELKNVELNEEFQTYADEHELDVKLDEPKIDEGYWYNMLHIGATLDGGESFEGFSGDSSMIDVTFEVISDAYYDGVDALGVDDFSYQQAGEEDVQDLPIFLENPFLMVPKHSILSGFITPEVFVNDDGFLDVRDYEKMGAKVYAESESGEVYHAELDEYGEYFFYDMPVSEKSYTVYFDVPGHLTMKRKVYPGLDYKGEFIGEDFWVDAVSAPAGDVNNDGVIDIYDVMRVVAQYGKYHTETDINKDGIVDEVDIRYIEKNFLKVGDDAKGKKPVEKLGPKGLNDFLRALGLEPAE